MAHLANDLAVTLPEDRPGMLAKAISALGNAGISLEGHAEMEGVVHVLTADVTAARRALNDAGFRVVTEVQVVLAPVDDHPGAAARIFQRIAEAKLNVRFSYLATRNRLVISTDDVQAALKALES